MSAGDVRMAAMPKTPAPYLAAAIESLMKIRDDRPSTSEELEANQLLWDVIANRLDPLEARLLSLADQLTAG
jgi:hypothetical protein